MSDIGYIQVLRELLRSDHFLSAPADQCKVLMVILDRACFTPCTLNDHGVEIHLLPGQLMTTLRELAKLSNTDKKVVERTISRFLTSGILGQEVRHKKTILTILWGMKIETSGTRKGTRKGQERDINEEYDNEKNAYIKDDRNEDRSKSSFKQKEENTGSSDDLLLESFYCYTFKDGTKIKEKTLLRWIKIYDFIEIDHSIKYYEKMNKKKTIGKGEAYLENCLKNKFWQVDHMRDTAKQREKEHERRKEELRRE